MNVGYHVTLSDQNGNMVGYLNPISCVISETLNGDDNLQMSCVYDDAGMWKQIKPGMRIGVWLERDAPDVGDENIFTDRYVVQDVPYEDRAFWDSPAINDIASTYRGHLSVGQTVKITGSYRYKGKTVYIISKFYNGSTQAFFVKGGILKIVRVDGNFDGDDIGDQDHNTGNGTEDLGGVPDAGDGELPWPGWDDAEPVALASMDTDGLMEKYVGDVDFVDTEYSLQQYCVRTVTMNDTINIEAVHITIESGDKLVYVERSNSDYPIIRSISTWIHVVNLFLSDSGQRKGNGIVLDLCEATAACNVNGIAMSINELFCSHLREIYGYEILRTGEHIELCQIVGRDRGVVLEVGRNLASLEVVYSNEDSDLDGVIAYCTYETADGREVSYAKDMYFKSAANMYTRYAIVEDSDASSQYEIGFYEGVEKKLEIDATALIDNDEYKLRGQYIVTVSIEPAQIDGIWNDTTIVLGDIVTIRDPRLPDGEVKRRVTQLQHDYLTGRIIEITVGDVPKTLYDVIKKMR